MIPWPALPYDGIGKAVVGIVVVALVAAAAATVVFGLVFVWVRGWTWVSNTAWRGYDPQGEYPPLWRLRIAGVTLALARFKLWKIPAAYREAEEIATDDVTAHVALRRYLSAVFLDDP